MLNENVRLAICIGLVWTHPTSRRALRSMKQPSSTDGAISYHCSQSIIGSFSYVCGIMAIALPAFWVENKRGGEPYPQWADLCFLGLYFVGQTGAFAFPPPGMVPPPSSCPSTRPPCFSGTCCS
jgi:hypothetical protein